MAWSLRNWLQRWSRGIEVESADHRPGRRPVVKAADIRIVKLGAIGGIVTDERGRTGRRRLRARAGAVQVGRHIANRRGTRRQNRRSRRVPHRESSRWPVLRRSSVGAARRAGRYVIVSDRRRGGRSSPQWRRAARRLDGVDSRQLLHASAAHQRALASVPAHVLSERDDVEYRAIGSRRLRC